VNVRLVRRTDAEALARLSGDLGYTTSDTEVRIRLGAILAHPDHAAFVAEHPDLGLLGWIHVFASLRIESGSFAEIGGLVVMEAQRRTGVGRALVEVAEQWTWERGLTMLRVRTNVNRSEAHDFYRKLDFREIKTQKVFVKEL
jgi:GNAT superfamily N-acetyltransferase